MRKTIHLIIGTIIALTATSTCFAQQEEIKPVQVVFGAKYLNQKVDDFKQKSAVYTEYASGVSTPSDQDYRNAKTDVNAFLANPGIKLWDTLTLYGIAGVMNLDYEFDTYDRHGAYDGKFNMEGDNAFAYGLGTTVKAIDKEGWTLVFGAEYLTQKADGTPYYTDATGRKQSFEEWGIEYGATGVEADYKTKFSEISINTTLAKQFDINNAIVTSIKPYAGIEWFTQTIKGDGTLTVQGVPTLDYYTDEWKFTKNGVSAILGLDASFFNNRLAIGPYGKIGAKQEIGGKITYTF